MKLALCSAAMADASDMADKTSAIHDIDPRADDDHGGREKERKTCPFAAVSIAALSVFLVVRSPAVIISRGDRPPIGSASFLRIGIDRLRPPLRAPPVRA